MHTVITTSANVNDATPAPKLLREDDRVAYGDAAYCAVEKHDEVKNDPNLSKIDFRVNKQKPYRKNRWIEGPSTYWLCLLEYQKSRVRSKVEYVFHIIKDIFGFRKTPYRGIRKLEAKLVIYSLLWLISIWFGQGKECLQNINHLWLNLWDNCAPKRVKSYPHSGNSHIY